MALNLSHKKKRLFATAFIVLAAWLAGQAGFDVSGLVGGTESAKSGAAPIEGSASSKKNAPSPPLFPASSTRDATRIERAIAERESGVMVTVDARVIKRLRDDLDGSRHQRFLVELAGGETLLIAHNIDLAARAKVEKGDEVRIRGQYEWNDRGGVLHWTHHDPAGRHPGGWIEAAGERVE